MNGEKQDFHFKKNMYYLEIFYFLMHFYRINISSDEPFYNQREQIKNNDQASQKSSQENSSYDEILDKFEQDQPDRVLDEWEYQMPGEQDQVIIFKRRKLID